MAIEITDGLAHLTIEVLARSRADGSYWDGNWVVTPITVALPGFQATFTEGMHLTELYGFYQDMKRLYSELKGIARLDVMEGFLSLNAEMGSLGQIQWSVEVAHPVGTGNEAHLRFVMNSDQSYLPALLDQIGAVLEEFPTEGEPVVFSERPPS